MTPVIHVKENNICSIKEVKRKIGKKRCKETWYDKKRSCEVKVYEESFEMDGVKAPFRFVKFSKKALEERYSQVLDTV